MILKLFVLLAAIAQVAAAALLPLGTFEQSVRPLPTFIQPASWAFSIWGLIYTLSFVYAVYQLIPKYDSELLQKTRVPAIAGFLGSIAWLYFAGQSSALIWLTFPTLLFIAVSFSTILKYNQTEDGTVRLFSRDFLLPYAAWAMIASWINAHTLLTEQGIITTDALNLVSNLLFLSIIIAATLYGLRRCHYNVFYGGVLIWASVGIVVANLEVNTFFSTVAGVYALFVTVLLARNYTSQTKGSSSFLAK